MPTKSSAAEVIPKALKIVGPQRHELTQQIVQEYLAGSTVRELAQRHGRSYGWIYTLLREGGVALRRRGRQPRTEPTRG